MDALKISDRPKIVVLDGYTLNPGDLDWTSLEALGDVSIYDYSAPAQRLERAKEAQIILTNKTLIDGALMEQLPALKCICLLATGYNVIDVPSAKARNIAVCNAVGYGSDSVAQHVFALLLELTNRVGAHNESVQKGVWSKNRDFSYSLSPIIGLAGKTMGIYGFGKIGQKVAEIAQAFGMSIIASHKHPERDARPGVEFVDLDQLFERSDVLSLHAPLSAQNQGLVNATRFTTNEKHSLPNQYWARRFGRRRGFETSTEQGLDCRSWSRCFVNGAAAKGASIVWGRQVPNHPT